MQKEKYTMVQRPLLICSNHLKLTNTKRDSSQALHIAMLLDNLQTSTFSDGSSYT